MAAVADAALDPNPNPAKALPPSPQAPRAAWRSPAVSGASPRPAPGSPIRARSGAGTSGSGLNKGSEATSTGNLGGPAPESPAGRACVGLLQGGGSEAREDPQGIPHPGAPSGAGPSASWRHMGDPPMEAVLVPPRATLAQLKRAAQKAFRRMYRVLEGLVVRAAHISCFSSDTSGGEVFFGGSV